MAETPKNSENPSMPEPKSFDLRTFAPAAQPQGPILPANETPILSTGSLPYGTCHESALNAQRKIMSDGIIMRGIEQCKGENSNRVNLDLFKSGSTVMTAKLGGVTVKRSF